MANGYYQPVKYVLDPVTNRVVQEGGSGESTPVRLARYSDMDVSTVGLPGASGQPGGGGFTTTSGGAVTRGLGGGGGAEGVASSESPATGPGDLGDFGKGIPGGWSTVGSVGGTLLGGPLGIAAGLVGNAVDVGIDRSEADDLNPDYDAGFTGWASAIGNELTGGLLGTSHLDQATDDLTDRHGYDQRGPAMRGGPRGASARDAARDRMGKAKAKSDMETERGRKSGGFGGGADRGGGADQGHGGGGDLGRDRDDRAGGPR